MTTELVELADRIDKEISGYRDEMTDVVHHLLTEAATAIRALASRAAVPDGFVLVPSEPTTQVIEAICAATTTAVWPDDFGGTAQGYRRNHARNAYTAMLDAAPEPVAVGS